MSGGGVSGCIMLSRGEAILDNRGEDVLMGVTTLRPNVLRRELRLICSGLVCSSLLDEARWNPSRVEVCVSELVADSLTDFNDKAGRLVDCAVFLLLPDDGKSRGRPTAERGGDSRDGS